ncbi:MAG: TolC family protein, partial [Alphaproteobacteria bacterium]|nr:TolC family protein [Alphaproteobacteria bacterium]
MNPEQTSAFQPRCILSLAAALMLSACAPDLGPQPELEAPQALATGKTFAQAAGDWPQDKWWTAYGDGELDSLEDAAFQGSPDLRIAVARLHEAQAAAQQAGADLLPTLSLDGSSQLAKQSLNQGFPKPVQSALPHGWHMNTRIAAGLNYELDLYGKNRAAYAAATSEEKAAEVDFQEARLVLSTSIAAAYANLVRLSADKAAAEDAVQIRQKSAGLFAEREGQGLENRGATAEAQANVYSARADEDVIDGQIDIVRNEIAALVGKGPDAGLDVPLPKAKDVHPLGVPAQFAADLIGRRPALVAER